MGMETKLKASGVVHDAQFDSSGRRVATASGDGAVRVWGPPGPMDNGDRQLLTELRVHRKAAVSVSWGCLHNGRPSGHLASGATDGHVVVWREAPNSESGWIQGHQVHVPGSVAALAFSPPMEGGGVGAGSALVSQLILAVAGADDLGIVTLYVRRETAPAPGGQGGEMWSQVSSFPAHMGGATCLSWAPCVSPVALASGPAVARANHVPANRRLATGGADGVVCIWHCDAKAANAWDKRHELAISSHVSSADGPVRDVAWRPNPGIPGGLIAACTSSGHVALWTQDAEGQPWSLKASWDTGADARRLSWSKTGTLFAVSIGDEGCLVFKEKIGGEWEQVADMSEFASLS